MKDLSIKLSAEKLFNGLGEYFEHNYPQKTQKVIVGKTEITVVLNSGDEIFIAWVDYRYKIYINDIYLADADETDVQIFFDKILRDNYVICIIDSWQGLIVTMGKRISSYPYNSIAKAFTAEEVLIDE